MKKYSLLELMVAISLLSAFLGVSLGFTFKVLQTNKKATMAIAYIQNTSDHLEKLKTKIRLARKILPEYEHYRTDPQTLILQLQDERIFVWTYQENRLIEEEKVNGVFEKRILLQNLVFLAWRYPVPESLELIEIHLVVKDVWNKEEYAFETRVRVRG
ncbi:MAG: hypothetical protein AABZ60_13900 [Planctomycetota bacterium]